MRKYCFGILLSCLLLLLTACGPNTPQAPPITLTDSERQANQAIIFHGDQNDVERNRLLAEDIRYFGEALPLLHLNPFDQISEQEFAARVEALAGRVAELDNSHVFVELSRIVAAIGDAHTNYNYWDGYLFPFEFVLLSGEVYVVNTIEDYQEALYCRLIGIDGRPLASILAELTEIIPHETESWLNSELAEYLSQPTHLYGLDLLEDGMQATFLLQDEEGEQFELQVPAYYIADHPGYLVSWAPERDVHSFDARYEPYYWYEDLPEAETIYFRYNVCVDSMTRGEGKSRTEVTFVDFNKELFDAISTVTPQKLIVDLRYNGGGNSSVLNPFLKSLKSYYATHPALQVYVLIGTDTFSSAILGTRDILEAVPEAVLAGQPTGGSLNHYGEVRTFELPNSMLTIQYSTKFFSYTEDGALGSIEPDLYLEPGIGDYQQNFDSVLDTILHL